MIIWIASYPKSGNTWVRAFITSLLFKKDKGTSFKDLVHINIYPRRTLLKKYTTNYHNFEELSNFWLPTQKDINKDNKVRFLKTHHATCKIKGNNFTDAENTLGRIYIVRDPRNVITSFANHNSKTLDETFNLLINDLATGNEKNDVEVYMGSWSFNFNSWKI